MKGFYRGISAVLLQVVPRNSIRFYTHEKCVEKLFVKKHWTSSFYAGIIAGITEAIFISTATETLKVKLVHDRLRDNPQFRGLFDGIRKII